MTAQTAGELYRMERRAIGASSDGRTIEVSPMTAGAAQALGTACATFGPWKHYGFCADQLAALFVDTGGDNRPFQVLVGGDLAGIIIPRASFLVGPYLAFIAVLPAYQGMRVGDALLGWFEAEARRGGKRQVWLCVTGVNEGALRFYRTHGWEIAATLPDLIRDGDDEIMMRKRLV